MSATTSTDRLRSVEKLLWKVCHKHRSQYGGSLSDLHNEALYWFTVANATYDPRRRVRFSSWVHTKVWFGLLQSREGEIRYRSRFKQIPFGMCPDRRRRRAVLGVLSPSAHDVATQALTLSRRPGRNPKKHLVRTLLRNGWTAVEVVSAFREIREALS